MAASTAFYLDLGFVLRYGGADQPFSTFSVGTSFLNLQADPAADCHGHVWGRVILWVDDVDAMYRRATAAGFSTETEPADAPWGERYFHLRDPSGHELSFARPLGR
jgi:catechol 2,3-dioxygenase-like lactoylglutathione lyase family enzyme